MQFHITNLNNLLNQIGFPYVVKLSNKSLNKDSYWWFKKHMQAWKTRMQNKTY